MNKDADIVDIFFEVFQNFKMIIIFSIIFSFLALSITYFIPKSYESKLTFMLTDANKNGIGSQDFGSISSLLSISDDKAKLNELLNIFKSRNFALSFIEEYNLYKYLIYIDSYDNIENTVVFKENYFNEIDGKWKYPDGSLHKNPPQQIAIDLLNKFLDIDYNQSKSLWIINAYHPSKNVSQMMVKLSYEHLEKTVAKKNELDFIKKIDSANLILERANNDFVRKMLTNYLNNAYVNQYLTGNSNLQGMSIIDATYLTGKSYPSRILFLIIGFFIGFFIGFIISVITTLRRYNILSR